MAALICIPILRYLVFTDRIEHFDRLLNLTVRPLELFAILGVVQIFKFLGLELVQPYIGVSGIESTLIVTVIATIVYIGGFELIFQKYQFSWGTLFYSKRVALEQQIDFNMEDLDEVTNEIFKHGSHWMRLKAASGLLKLTLIRVTFGQVAFHLLKNSIPDRDDEAIDELRNYIKMNQRDDAMTDSRGLWIAFAISGIVVLPTLVVIAGLISFVIATFGVVVLVMITMRLSKHIVALSYIAFGTMDYEQFVTTNRRWAVMMTGYTLAVYFVIFTPSG